MVEEVDSQGIKRVCVKCLSDKTDTWLIARKNGNVYLHSKWNRGEQYGISGWLCARCTRKIRYKLGLTAPSTRIATVTLKTKLMGILEQNSCVYCNCMLFQCLEFDHINGKGNEDRKRFLNNPVILKRYYINHPEEARLTLQVVCANCNILKRWRKNENSRWFKTYNQKPITV